ncbi:MAG TPA: hypothetical protein DDZ38_02480, partial [Gammaproteobacteria bacterium]|nr:hypothetical protein [Gammaproteobacteria bacterium]
MQSNYFVLLSGLLSLGCLGTAQADEADHFYVEGTYFRISAELDPGEVNLGLFGVNLGYQFSNYLAAEVLLTVGIGDDDYEEVTLEYDHVVGVVLKPMMRFGDQFKGYLKLGYSSMEATASSENFSFTEDQSGFLWGAGIEMDFSESLYGGLGYIDIDGDDGFSAALGYRL